MRPFHFIRHGQTDWNVEGRFQGHSDIPLNKTGLAQATTAADHYASANYNITRIVSSPLQRALVTGQHIAARLNVPLETNPDLIERCHGALETRLVSEIDEMSDEIFAPDAPVDHRGYRLPRGAEPVDDLAHRAADCVLSTLEKYPDDTILFVSHGAWYSALVRHLTKGETQMHSDNATPYRCEPMGDTWHFKKLVA